MKNTKLTALFLLGLIASCGKPKMDPEPRTDVPPMTPAPIVDPPASEVMTPTTTYMMTTDLSVELGNNTDFTAVEEENRTLERENVGLGAKYYTSTLKGIDKGVVKEEHIIALTELRHTRSDAPADLNENGELDNDPFDTKSKTYFIDENQVQFSEQIISSNKTFFRKGKDRQYIAPKDSTYQAFVVIGGKKGMHLELKSSNDPSLPNFGTSRSLHIRGLGDHKASIEDNGTDISITDNGISYISTASRTIGIIKITENNPKINYTTPYPEYPNYKVPQETVDGTWFWSKALKNDLDKQKKIINTAGLSKFYDVWLAADTRFFGHELPGASYSDIDDNINMGTHAYAVRPQIHEVAHRYHNTVVGLENMEVKNLYSMVSSNTNVAYGDEQNSYWRINHGEFFAETLTTYIYLKSTENGFNPDPMFDALKEVDSTFFTNHMKPYFDKLFE